MKHLGVRWDMSVDNDTQKRMAEEQLTAALTRMVTMSCTMDLKRGVLEGSVFQLLVFHLRFAPWSLNRFKELDVLVNKALRRILGVDAHWPTELLYLAKEEGGMGLIRLSNLVHERKLALVARLDEEGTEGRALMTSLLHRNLNMSNTIPPSGMVERWSQVRAPPGRLAWSSGWGNGV